MTRPSKTLSGLARVCGNVALMACLVGSAMSAHVPGRALAMQAPMAQPVAASGAPLGRAGDQLASAAGRLERSTTGMLLRVDHAGGPSFSGRGAWDTLPAGLRAALAHLHLGRGAAAAAPHSARWAPDTHGLRSDTHGPRPAAARPSCQCGGGGGPTWSQQAELTAADSASGDWFGDSVVLSSDGNTAVVGAPYANNSKGAVYIFYLNNGAWSEIGKLTAADGAGGDDFGKSVALGSDDTVLIGANNENSGRGTAYVFVPAPYFGWMQQAELNDPNGAIDDSFGSAVALSGDGSTALIGAPNVNIKGAAYVFARNGSAWSQTAELTAANAVPYIDDLGISLALSGDGSTALIGDPNGNNGTGAAYVFGLNGGSWSQQAELIAADAANGDNFGWSVALGSNGSAGPIALIGAPNKNSYTGAAYVFAPFFGWTQQAELTASDGAAFDSFGGSVALNSTGSASPVALIGAYYKNTDTGAAYLFEDKGSFGPWVQAQTLTASDGVIGDSFGQSVALNGDGSTALIGANSKNSFTGAAYIFSTSATPAASLVSSPTSASPYQTVTLTGTNFGAAEPVKLFWDSTASTPLTTTTTLASGSFVTHVTVPQSPAGAHTLLALGQSSARSASAPLSVKPAVVLSPNHGKAGSVATMIGVGFGAGETVAALWYPGLKPLKSGPSNALGTVTLTVTVPLSPTGSYAVLGYGLTTKQYGAASFQVTP